ncbi:nucleotidyltransferase domain-containing protein [Kineococcus terrestris]|uniref:nucleotidyltransferase domain-containing protein n=1 Tax=Kineococcus terrestris TaxID=2044856 RepID=UPI0034DAC935
MDLQLPDHLSDDHQRLIVGLAERNDTEHRDGLLGLVLSGSAARGMATDRSDLDIYVVLSDEAAQQRWAIRSTTVDELPVTLTDLEQVPAFGSGGWGFRWSFAWAPTLLDRTAGRIAAALHRQATLSPDEIEAVLVEHSRLDGWLNYVYRALKSDRDGHRLECRLDAAESMPWLLDVVFALAGRVRPYHKYLPWELREHPLPDWPADVLLPLLRRTLDGDPAALRDAFVRVEAGCAAHDAAGGRQRTTEIIDGWGDGLLLMRP